MKLPWWLRRPFVQAQRTVQEAQFAADAYRFLTAIEAEEKCLAQLDAGVPAAPDNRVGINLAAHDACELIYGMGALDDDRNTRKENQ